MNATPSHLIGAERRTYLAGADKARAAYRKRHGATTLRAIAERRAWQLQHAAPMSLAADRGGMSAVRKMHTARVEHLATITAPDRIGGPAAPDFLATITRDAEHAAERLEVLAPARKATATRKPAARKLASVPTPVETPAPVVEVDTSTAPATVPAPMPAMTRAARKATRRELAATMRAAGIRPEGDAWREACAAAGLPVRESVPA